MLPSIDGATGMGSPHEGRGSGNDGIWQWKDLLARFKAVRDVPDTKKSLLVAPYRGLRGTNRGPLQTPPTGP